MNSLDGLFLTEARGSRPVFIKCDVEGAELLVLRGGKRFLAEQSPTLLLSVHPPVLPKFGHSTEAIRDFLNGLGYSITLVAQDHEEHWWCKKGSSS